MRLFIAIQFTDRIKNALSYLQQDMRDCGLKGNYTRDENLHLTLAFIGEYGNPDEVLDALDSLDFEPFRLTAVEAMGICTGQGLKKTRS